MLPELALGVGMTVVPLGSMSGIQRLGFGFAVRGFLGEVEVGFERDITSRATSA